MCVRDIGKTSIHEDHVGWLREVASEVENQCIGPVADRLRVVAKRLESLEMVEEARNRRNAEQVVAIEIPWETGRYEVRITTDLPMLEELYRICSRETDPPFELGFWDLVTAMGTVLNGVRKPV